MNKNLALVRPQSGRPNRRIIRKADQNGKDICFTLTYRPFLMRKCDTKLACPKIAVICYTNPLKGVGDTQIFQANQRLPEKETVKSPNIFVAYLRVSTARQGVSGLGLEAQRAATTAYLAANGGELMAEITEVESGKKDQRPELKSAIEMCRKTGATLLIAKLDRLARNVAFTANLLESGVRFVAVDMPNADKFMMHVYAAMAEEEGRRISERTRAALASAKARGIQLGANGIALAAKNKAAAETRALAIEDTLRCFIRTEVLTCRQAADRLNAMQVPTASGMDWNPTSVFRVWKRIENVAAREALGTVHLNSP